MKRWTKIRLSRLRDKSVHAADEILPRAMHSTTVLPTVVSLQTGQVQPLAIVGSSGQVARVVDTAIAKKPQLGSVYCGIEGLAGDHQADRRVHGGIDKAILAYSSDHFSYWEDVWGRSPIAGSFGENLTLQNLTEAQACVGDRYEAGDCILEVSQPRQPCFKLAAYQRQPRLVRLVVESGFSGWYFRVVQPGYIRAGAVLQLVERPWPEWTITRANDLLYEKTIDPVAMSELYLLPQLATAWKRDLG